MTVKEPVAWAIHAGRTGDAHPLFTKHTLLRLVGPRWKGFWKIPPKPTVFTDQSMIDRAKDEKMKGRIPLECEIRKVELLADLAAKVAESQRIASEEVSHTRELN
ncbi:MAG: hypothetical protein A2X66_06125 [Ignavibacteria bacterium GWA2_54_16]|nr:MAG: hypothetical protein A2X66_06125 [Ignavibacteria bacterium GWA2_54_16]